MTLCLIFFVSTQPHIENREAATPRPSAEQLLEEPFHTAAQAYIGSRRNVQRLGGPTGKIERRRSFRCVIRHVAIRHVVALHRGNRDSSVSREICRTGPKDLGVSPLTQTVSNLSDIHFSNEFMDQLL